MGFNGLRNVPHVRWLKVKAGTIALVQYVTAVLMIFLVAWHLAVRIPWLQGVEDFPATMGPEIVYDEVKAFWPLLLLLSIAVIIHGVNGLRGILLEWVGSNERLKLVVNVLSILVVIVLLLVAVHTLIAIPELG
jgi:succinate dehydrogenase / fumarate reductase membrane anchor subunit